MKTITITSDFESWRDAARELLDKRLPPSEVFWSTHGDGKEGDSLLDFDQPAQLREEPVAYQARPQRSVPKAFFDLAERVSCHRSDQQWPLLYDLLWRITEEGEKNVLNNITDPTVHKLSQMTAAIRRDIHKMRAFVRFRSFQADGGGEEQYMAWFEPEHRIVRLNTAFFRKRFTGMRWSILTADECVHWDREKIYYTPGISKDEVPVHDDALEEFWLTYYRSTFNPARVKIKMMQSEMPKKYWKNLPEAQVIGELIQGSARQVMDMYQANGKSGAKNKIIRKR